MAEEPSPLSPSSENSPSSHKRRITQNPSLNLTLEFNSSTLELGTSQTQQQTQSFPQQSPKKPKFSSLNHSPPPTTADEGYIIHDDDDENTQNLGKKQLIIDDCEVEFQEKGSENDQLGGENFNFGDKIEVSELGLAKNYVGADQKEVIEDLNDEKLILGDKIEDSDMGFVRNDVGFDEKEVIDENLGVLGDNTAEFGCDKKDENAENFDGVLPKMAKTEDSASSKLMIEVMDGTALVDVSLVEEKRNRRRGNNHNRNHNHKKSNPRNNASVSNEGKKKCVYSRKELEVLRYMNVKGQRKFWQEIYNGFSATVKKEYDEVGSFRHHKHGGPSSDNHNNGGMRNFTNGGIMGTCSIVPNYNNRGILGESCSENVSCEAEFISPSIHEGHNSGEDVDDLVEEWSEDEESDEEFECIHRPAFKVEGEPDFESGPPEDGLEYLRRVRWEARQIPKVKIAKLDNIKHKDQSVYMPEIPDIAECPPHLLPLKQWEDEFIADFSKLRLDLSRLEDTSDAVSSESELVIFARHGQKSKPHSENTVSLELTSGSPMLSTVLAMDPVSRVTMLRKRINVLESASSLSKDDCAWLFALCAVVDTPLDADTCASLRCLLRGCAKLRATKAEVDDEVIMLNVLATISGKFFGQSGN